MLKKIEKELFELKDNRYSKISTNFFKTGKWDYSFWDIFLWIKIPLQRKIAKKFINANLLTVKKLLTSKYHEFRSVALLILVYKYENCVDINCEKEIYDFYMDNIDYVNNWDLVDISSYKIVWSHLLNQKDKNILYELSESDSLRKRRISIVSTYQFIKNNLLEDTIKISQKLLSDEEDLIHKAVWWMLRELWKRDILLLKNFLKDNYKDIPRTTLRYSIEKFEDTERKNILIWVFDF